MLAMMPPGGHARLSPYDTVINYRTTAAMKNLIVIRHAKSSWDDPSLADIDRPLNQRGKRDAPLMGSILRLRELTPDRMVSSPAKRARKTAKLIAKEVGYDTEAIDLRENLYLAEAPALVELIRALDDAWSRVYLIGHNPGLTGLVSRLAGENLAHLPTCGVASIEFAVDSWAHLMKGAGRLAFFDYPKRHL
jgi:phosphohistidine phosphatase